MDLPVLFLHSVRRLEQSWKWFVIISCGLRGIRRTECRCLIEFIITSNYFTYIYNPNQHTQLTMDFVKNAMSGGSKSGDASKSGSNNQEDYVDKGVDFLNKKVGVNISRDNQEKATDFARSQYEKSTGNKVDPKISN
ncbi:hypothetical protein FOZG_14776 [Fusarium oxysporum Fo47]|uniref:Uncharacterized protein n=1 Tax=Fusarium oxysporum Fo47 TaxID=660027 RepID=W9JPU6_FUSOX|nr:hypothetical protein FOZG_14776 [Fusarium oxysporum Fo47]